jgi:transcriptional regulator with XRE-family HTH domain
VTSTVKESKRTEHDENILAHFAINLRKARNAHGYSQEELAHLAGFSRSYYTEIETGHRNISLLNLYKILAVLKISANDLINFQERE